MRPRRRTGGARGLGSGGTGRGRGTRLGRTPDLIRGPKVGDTADRAKPLSRSAGVRPRTARVEAFWGACGKKNDCPQDCYLRY